MPEPQTTPSTIADTPVISDAAVGSAKVTGAIFVAPASVQLPTDATTQLSSDYKLLSFTSDGGLTLTENSSSKTLRIWEGMGTARTLKTERTEQLKFTPVNLNQRVAEATWGSGAVEADTETGALSIGHHGNTTEPINIVIEMVPFAGAIQRLCAKAQLSAIGDATYNGQDYQGRELTFDCLTGSDGCTMHEYVAYVAATDGE